MMRKLRISASNSRVASTTPRYLLNKQIRGLKLRPQPQKLITKMVASLEEEMMSATAPPKVHQPNYLSPKHNWTWRQQAWST